MTADGVDARYGAVLDAPVVAVWPYFDWPNLARMVGDGLFAGVRYDDVCVVAGARREVTLANGVCLTEVLEACDAAAGCFAYRILDNDALPVRDYRGAVMVTAVGETRTRVDFSSHCRLAGIDADAWRMLYADMQAGFVAHIAARLTASGG